jgi:hypothetical protein
MTRKHSLPGRSKRSQAGNVLFYVLVAVGLFAALNVAFMKGGADSGVAMSANRMAQLLKTQAHSIRASVIECVLTYPDAGYPAEAPSGLARDIECDPADRPAYGVFSGQAGRFMPQPPQPFNAWQYTNDGAGTIQISIATDTADASDPGVTTALGYLEPQFSSDEVTIVNDGTTASFTLILTSP